MDNLARNAMLAKQAGMSYGKWKALHPTTPPQTDTEQKIPDDWSVCQYCGKAFKPRTNRPQKFCGFYCQRQNHYTENKEKYRERNRLYRQRELAKKAGKVNA